MSATNGGNLMVHQLVITESGVVITRQSNETTQCAVTLTEGPSKTPSLLRYSLAMCPTIPPLSKAACP